MQFPPEQWDSLWLPLLDILGGNEDSRTGNTNNVECLRSVLAGSWMEGEPKEGCEQTYRKLTAGADCPKGLLGGRRGLMGESEDDEMEQREVSQYLPQGHRLPPSLLG